MRRPRAYPRCMTIAAFDALAYARRLKEAGVDEAQAEAVRDAVTEGVAARADLADLETRLTVRLYGVAAEIVAVNTALIVALVKLLPA